MLFDMVSALGLGPGSTILDVGSGTGWAACRLAERTPAQVLCIDVVPSLLATARKAVHDAGLQQRITVEAASILDIPVESGRIDALISNHIPSLFLKGALQIVRLFPDYKAVEQNYYKRTGLFPIMHMVAMRADLNRKEPHVAARVYEAFCQARDLAVTGLYDTDALRLALPWLIDHVEETRRVLGRDYWIYGSEQNRKVWNALCDYQVEQQLSPRNAGLDGLFVTG